MGNQLFVVVSDARIAKDLLVSNGAIFSSRKPYFMKNQTILRGRALTASPYNDTWSVVNNDPDETGKLTFPHKATASQDRYSVAHSESDSGLCPRPRLRSTHLGPVIVSRIKDGHSSDQSGTFRR